jgi:hypothetical protein
MLPVRGDRGCGMGRRIRRGLRRRHQRAGQLARVVSRAAGCGSGVADRRCHPAMAPASLDLRGGLPGADRAGGAGSMGMLLVPAAVAAAVAAAGTSPRPHTSEPAQMTVSAGKIAPAAERQVRLPQRGIRLAHVQAPSSPEVDRWLAALLVLREGEERSRQADRWAGRLHLRRVRRPLWRDHREGAEGGKVNADRPSRQSRYLPLTDPPGAEPTIPAQRSCNRPAHAAVTHLAVLARGIRCRTYRYSARPDARSRSWQPQIAQICAHHGWCRHAPVGVQNGGTARSSTPGVDHAR